MSKCKTKAKNTVQNLQEPNYEGISEVNLEQRHSFELDTFHVFGGSDHELSVHTVLAWDPSVARSQNIANIDTTVFTFFIHI